MHVEDLLRLRWLTILIHTAEACYLSFLDVQPGILEVGKLAHFLAPAQQAILCVDAVQTADIGDDVIHVQWLRINSMLFSM